MDGYLVFSYEDGSKALAHYGVKGMKWGVRRYQNKDRTLTSLGKKHDRLNRKTKRAMSTSSSANDIVATLSRKDRRFLGAEKKEPWIKSETEREQSSNIAKRFVVSDSETNQPACFLEVWDNGGTVGQVALATRNGKEYRGKGYATKAAKQAVDWYNRYGYKHLEAMEWIVNKKNVASIAVAKKAGFKETDMKEFHPDWGDYPEYAYLTYRK